MDFHQPFFIHIIFFLVFFAHSALHSSGWLQDRNMQKGSSLKLIAGASSATFDPTRVIQLSWRPRAFLYKNFLTDEECDHLILLAKDKLEKSMVADNKSGKSIESKVRTSSGMFLMKAQDEVVAGIESRLAAWTFLPVENGESIQILHYEHGQKYEPHFDFFRDKANQKLGGHRVATVLMYLSNVERGGETVFPNSEEDNKTKDDSVSDCAKKGYSVKPQKGDALLFFSLHPDASTDSLSLHGSCPVIEGEKWSATKWIHVRSFDRPQTTSGKCTDENENCAQWAAAGECEKNPHYMVGSKVDKGYCRKSCKDYTDVGRAVDLDGQIMRPDLKHDNFTPQEEEQILKLHKAIGSRRSGRTDNGVKNHWNTKLRKKLLKMEIDPVTHTPFSQIFTEYGNKSGLTNTINHIESFNKFAANKSIVK